MESLLKRIQQKLPDVRKIGFCGSETDDNHLMWAFLFDLMREGYALFEQSHPKSKRTAKLYEGATGIHYGVDYDDSVGEYGCRAFAGYSKIDNSSFAVLANFNVLPSANHYMGQGAFGAALRLNEAQKKGAEAIWSEELAALADFYDRLAHTAVKILDEHAPKAVGL